jgi:spartin
MASAPHAEAFALLTLPDVLLSTSVGTERGSLVVECVTPHTAPGVVLVIRVGALEAVIDPRRQVTLSAGTGEPRVYTFHAIPDDPSELILTLPALSDTNPKANAAAADVETLDTVLEQYVHFTPHTPHLAVSPDHQTYQLEDAEEDFRGRLVLVDETNGEVLGAVGERDTIRADPILQTKGHEKDAVVIDVGDDSELGARQRFAQAIPPGEHDAITRTASMLR